MMNTAAYNQMKSLIKEQNERIEFLDKQLTEIRHTLAYLTPEQYDLTVETMNDIKTDIKETRKMVEKLRRQIKDFLKPATM